MISEPTGPILRIHEHSIALEKIIEGKQILMNSGSPVTSQVQVKVKMFGISAEWN